MSASSTVSALREIVHFFESSANHLDEHHAYVSQAELRAAKASLSPEAGLLIDKMVDNSRYNEIAALRVEGSYAFNDRSEISLRDLFSLASGTGSGGASLGATRDTLLAALDVPEAPRRAAASGGSAPSPAAPPPAAGPQRMQVNGHDVEVTRLPDGSVNVSVDSNAVIRGASGSGVIHVSINGLNVEVRDGEVRVNGQSFSGGAPVDDTARRNALTRRFPGVVFSGDGWAASIAESVVIAPGARITGAVQLSGNARIGARAELEGGTITGGQIHGRVTGGTLRDTRVALDAAVNGGVVTDSRVGPSAVVNGGVLTGVHVGARAVINGGVHDGTTVPDGQVVNGGVTSGG